MRKTIKDVARETGFSISTVSLALSNKESRVSAATRQLVREAAKEMNYRPNQLASGLITRRTNMLGIILPDISNDFFARIAKGAGYEADLNNHSLMLFDTNDNPDKDIHAINTLVEHSADGILLTSSAVGNTDRLSDCLDMCDRDNIPVVLVDRESDIVEAHTVMIDQELGGYIAAKHLLDYGHKRIGCITGPMVTSSSKKRLFGYIKAIQEKGITFDSSLVLEGDYNTKCGYELAEKLVDKDITAIFAFNDLIAYGAYWYLREKNFSVPGDISIIGFDDIHFSQFIETPLSTVHQPVFDIGREAVSKLIRMINKESVDMKTIFNPELKVRASTAFYKERSIAV